MTHNGRMMRTKLFRILVPAVAGAVCSAWLQGTADVIFDADFTQAEGWSDGGLGWGAPNPDTAIAQGGFTLSDTAGAGILNGPSGWQRALFGWPGPDETYITSLPAGSTVSVVAAGLTINALTGANRNLLVFGLADVDSANILGGTGHALGGHLVADDVGNIYVQSDSFNIDLANAVDTGFDLGQTFDYAVRYTSLGGGNFQVEQLVNDTVVMTEPSRTFNFGKSGTTAPARIQDWGGLQSYTVDRITYTVTPVPEPSSYALVLLGAAAFFARRRRA